MCGWMGIDVTQGMKLRDKDIYDKIRSELSVRLLRTRSDLFLCLSTLLNLFA